MRITLLGLGIVLMLVITSKTATAQPQLGSQLEVAGGLGYSLAYDRVDDDVVFDGRPAGLGAAAQLEYAWGLTEWVGVRSYAAVLVTQQVDAENVCGNQSDFDCLATSQALFLGAKARLAIPIPLLAPFIELGLGGSIGRFRTHTLETRKEHDGLLLHVPLAFGLAIGPDHEVEVSLQYFIHPAVFQADGGFMLGLNFPLE